ncbi:unnamed protein product [Trifolium pratense]|uniref:Uncharacterized protein n=1 Tax=Trifolium pratense TaxID=57577 RepID=A0ACB0J669_TRIPR|nr:unnamed protein product [Trifolium pratense]
MSTSNDHRSQAENLFNLCKQTYPDSLLDIEDDPAWHAALTEDEDAGETTNYGFGQECLDRLSISLGGNTIVPVASELLPTYLVSPEWQKHNAALVAIAQIAEGCSKVMTKNLEHVLSMVLNSFSHPHPRVRWTAINAIGQLSTDLGPDLQVKYHHLVLSALAGAMDDFENARVQAHAASAVLNFTENCTPDLLIPRLDVLTRDRVNTYQPIREEVLSHFVKWISSQNGSPINLTEAVISTIYTIVSRAAFGNKCDQEKFISVAKEAIKLLAGFDLGDLFPSAKWLQNLTGIRPKLDWFHRLTDEILENIMNEHKEEKYTKEKDDQGEVEKIW